MSLRNRLLAAVLAVLLCGLAAADTTIYISMRSFLIGRINQQLVAASQSLTAEITAPENGGQINLDQLNAIVPGVFVEVRDSAGSVLASSASRARSASALPELPAQLPKVGSVFDVRSGTAGEFRVKTSAISLTGFVLVVALPLHESDETLQRILVVEALVTVCMLVAALGGGLWLVRVGLRPLDDIRNTARTIGQGDLTQRVARDDDNTEVGQLGHSLNLMLAQIETAFEQRTESEERMRRFVADASHELRTPLSAIRAYAELFDRGASGNPDDLARSMRGISGQATRMGSLVDDLLLLTRLDQGRPFELIPVDLSAIAAEAVEDAAVIAPDRPVALELNGAVVVAGDAHRLRQVFDNLLTNARTHTPTGSDITLTVASAGPLAVLTVADDGPGLTAEQQTRVFERFYRADSARTRASGGSGLGLAIVASVAAAHGGTVSVHSEPGAGAGFTVRIPLLDGPEESE